MMNQRTRWILALSALLLCALGPAPSRAQDTDTAGDADTNQPAAQAPADPPAESSAEPSTAPDAADADTAEATDAEDAGPGASEANPGSPDRPDRGRRRGGPNRGGRGDRGDAGSDETRSFQNVWDIHGDASEEMVSLAFKNMPMEQVAKFISEKTGKPVIPAEGVSSKRITIVAGQRMPLPVAMQTLREALRLSGVIIEEGERTINLRPIAEAGQSDLRVLGPDDSIQTIDDPARIVRKIFAVQHYDVTKLEEAIRPMLPDYGNIVVDPSTSQVVVTDTLGGLRRIQQVIRSLDLQKAGGQERQIFKLENADAAWVVQILQGTLGQVPAKPQQNNDRRRRRPWERGNDNNQATVGGQIVSIAGDKGQITLVPELGRNWIIAVAPSEVMDSIRAWIDRLDQPTEKEQPFALFRVQFTDVSELSSQLNSLIESMPNLQGTVSVLPFPNSRRLMVFGSEDGRSLVRELLNQLDVADADSRVMETIVLEYADAQTVADNIATLFDNRVVTETSRWGRTEYGQAPGSSQVKTTADTRRNAVTIQTDPATMKAIKTMIDEQWDQPLSNDAVQPKVYELKFADPQQVSDLLTNLFSDQNNAGGGLSFFFFGGSSDTQSSPVGRLSGQFTFEALPNSNRLVVTTSTPSNFEVIDKLIKDLDQSQEAGLPYMIELKHAYCEDLAEQINASLAEPGTLAQIRRAKRELSDDTGSSSISAALNNNADTSGGNGNDDNQPENTAGQITFWWQRAQDDPTEQPTSNLIGKIRVVPIVRRNALLILAPDAYHQPIRDMIQKMDEPGSQVIIHAVIAEIQHNDQTTLGLRLASDPSVFANPDLADQAIGGSANVQNNQLFAAPFTLGSEEIARGIFRSGLNVNVLIQLLMRKFGLQILFEPKLYTADNQEAEFFDGQSVSIQTDSQTTDQGTLNRSFTYIDVGTTLRVRPQITNEGDVDLNINLELSSISSGESTFGNPVFDRRETSTHVVIHNGQTIMLSGIVRQEQFNDVRKLPLLGDIPLLGKLFRSTDKAQRNRELIVFITPRVIGSDPAEVDKAMAPFQNRLRNLKREMGQVDANRQGQTPQPTTVDSPEEIASQPATEPETVQP